MNSLQTALTMLCIQILTQISLNAAFIPSWLIDEGGKLHGNKCDKSVF